MFALPALSAYVALATVPIILVAAILVNKLPSPLKKFALTKLPPLIFSAVILPNTVKLVRLPTLVIFGCALELTVVAAKLETVIVPMLAISKYPVMLVLVDSITFL